MPDSTTPAAWRPGLPSEPCVCDVRVRGRVLRNLLCKTNHCYSHVCFHAGGLKEAQRTGGEYEFHVPENECEWRPIEVPRGV